MTWTAQQQQAAHNPRTQRPFFYHGMHDQVACTGRLQQAGEQWGQPYGAAVVLTYHIVSYSMLAYPIQQAHRLRGLSTCSSHTMLRRRLLA